VLPTVLPRPAAFVTTLVTGVVAALVLTLIPAAPAGATPVPRAPRETFARAVLPVLAAVADVARTAQVQQAVIARSSARALVARQLHARAVRLEQARVAAIRARAARARALAKAERAREQQLRFSPGHAYDGTFADPSVLRVGRSYYAFSTTTGRDNLPVMQGSNLRHWYPRPALRHPHPRRTGSNDAMPVKPRWAVHRHGRGRDRISLWAPAAAKVGHRYVVAYSAAVRWSPRKSCIGIATSRHPLGPYRDRHRRPLVCYHPSLLGAIDPDVFVDPRTHAAYLLWKNEGIPHRQRPQLMVRRLDHWGTGFGRGSYAVHLLQNSTRWEGRVVENPAMLRYHGHLYLFYSANHWFSRQYAIGYARCRTPLGPCVRAGRGPLLASGRGVVGPGGGDPFVDRSGRLRLAYAAWSPGKVGPGPGHLRRLHVAVLHLRPHGFLGLRRLF
jgi:hypothetical protein